MQNDKFQEYLEKFLDENGSIMVSTPRYRQLAADAEKWRAINNGVFFVVRTANYEAMVGRLDKALDILRRLEQGMTDHPESLFFPTLGEIREVLHGKK